MQNNLCGSSPNVMIKNRKRIEWIEKAAGENLQNKNEFALLSWFGESMRQTEIIR